MKKPQGDLVDVCQDMDEKRMKRKRSNEKQTWALKTHLFFQLIQCVTF